MINTVKNMTWWVIGIVFVLVLFGDLVFALIGSVFGAIITIGITGIVLFVVATAAFALVMLVGGSVAVATGIAAFAVVVAALGALWPLIIVAVIIYLMVRKRSQAV